MYLWKINQLKETLSTTGLSQKSSLSYLLIFGVVVTGGMEFMAYVPYENINIWRQVITVGYLLFAVVGTCLFYKANGGSSGENIFERYISLGVVVTIRLIPLMVALMIGLGVYLGITQGVEDDFMAHTTLAEVVITLFWAFLVWYKMVSHVRDVANA